MTTRSVRKEESPSQKWILESLLPERLVLSHLLLPVTEQRSRCCISKGGHLNLLIYDLSWFYLKTLFSHPSYLAVPSITLPPTSQLRLQWPTGNILPGFTWEGLKSKVCLVYEKEKRRQSIHAIMLLTPESQHSLIGT